MALVGLRDLLIIHAVCTNILILYMSVKLYFKILCDIMYQTMHVHKYRNTNAN